MHEMMKYDNMHLITQKMDLENQRHKFLIINKHRYLLGNNTYIFLRLHSKTI